MYEPPGKRAGRYHHGVGEKALPEGGSHPGDLFAVKQKTLDHGLLHVHVPLALESVFHVGPVALAVGLYPGRLNGGSLSGV